MKDSKRARTCNSFDLDKKQTNQCFLEFFDKQDNI